MNIKKLEIESTILGKNIYKLEEITAKNSFKKEESSIIKKYSPFYIQCTIDAGELDSIHKMEDAGFRFVEFRYKKTLDINTFHSISEFAFYPNIIKLIADKEDYEKAELLLKNSIADDRFSRDPIIPAELSQNRLQAYLKKSYDNYPDEFIYGLFNKNTGELLAIKTGEIKSKIEATFSQTALKEDLDIEKLTYMIDALIISKLKEAGTTIFSTVTSGFNMMEMDLHISGLKYKIVSTSVILRKIYN
ncbi:MAG: hypothetical protein K9H49_14005 [Bacteroidales bacterium]|nr:hypothetical protein [Bacteroidales bacterium]MCF8390285.1 hypothetical protein [Bacteroidales bacterium]